MGKIIKISTEKIKPSQNFLKEKTVKFILRNIFEGNEDNLPPSPMVRNDVNNLGEYIAIDGHNLIAVKDLLEENIEVYVARNENDFIEGNSDAVSERNEELKEKFNLAQVESRKTKKEGIATFKDLREKYFYLNDVEKARSEVLN